MHTANRFVLLGILLSSVVLPFADVPVFRETTVVPQFEAIHEFIATPQEISVVPIQNEINETIAETPALLSAINWVGGALPVSDWGAGDSSVFFDGACIADYRAGRKNKTSEM